MLYKGLKGAASIPTNDPVPPNRNHHSLAFQPHWLGLTSTVFPQIKRDGNSLTDSLISASECAEDSVTKSKYENPQKLTQLSPRSHPRHLVGKRTAQTDTIKDNTSDSQVNSYFPCRWSPANLIFDIYNSLLLLSGLGLAPLIAGPGD